MSKEITLEELPEYLVFLILANVRELKKLKPDHILVKAVENAVEGRPQITEQLELLDVPAFLRAYD